MLRSASRKQKLALAALGLTAVVGLLAIPAPRTGAADHGDAPAASNDRSADIADVYAFLDPNDNTRVVLALTVNGFIVPSEAANFGIFDYNLRYRLELETSGDPTPDHFIDITFSEKTTSAATPQTATVKSTFFGTFTAPTTVANLNPDPPNPVITTDAASEIRFFAGVVDDPFFFDIPGFNRFVASVLNNAPDPSQLQRGRDSFAGYNILSIALSIPAQLIRGSLASTAGDTLGVGARTARLTNAGGARRPSRFSPSPIYQDVDRMGNPAVNVALIPYARKNEYNSATGADDMSGRFAADIIATLTRLGTNPANIAILASVAVAKGDLLRLSLTTANTGTGGGSNMGGGFPNGRRLGDDTIDTILFFVANQPAGGIGDNVPRNEVTLRDNFPFFAPPHQPFAPGTTDDRTRNE